MLTTATRGYHVWGSRDQSITNVTMVTGIELPCGARHVARINQVNKHGDSSISDEESRTMNNLLDAVIVGMGYVGLPLARDCLLYTSPSPRDRS